MKLFVSTFTNKIDRKGRVSIPAPFRAVLAQESFNGAVLLPSFRADCLDGMGMSRLETLAQGLDEQTEAFSDEQDEMAALIFAEAKTLTWDAEGRVVLPEEFLAHAHLNGEAMFIGKARTFEIWEPSAGQAVIADIRAKAVKKRPTMRVPGRTPDGGGGA
jgi:MraZ protein